MKIRIQPYKRWSGGAKALGIRAGILRATQKQVDKHGDFDYIINWGSSERKFQGEYINPPEAVALASNKLEAAKRFAEHGVPQPEFTERRAEAQEWLDNGDTVVGRHLLRACAGRGISLYRRRHEDVADDDAGRDEPDGKGGRRNQNPEAYYEADLRDAPLYTKYFKKQDEYRVHVFAARVLDVQQKKKRQEVPNAEVDYQVRNAAAGWVFCREGVECPESVSRAAVQAVDALGLDFGAVDIGYHRGSDTCAVFEVNTAPGVEGSTLDSYYAAFTEVFPALSGGAYKRRRLGLPVGRSVRRAA